MLWIAYLWHLVSPGSNNIQLQLNQRVHSGLCWSNRSNGHRRVLHGAMAVQIGMDGVLEAMTPGRGSIFFVMMRGIVPAIDSNARESHCAPSSVDRQRLCGGGVMQAGSVRTGMEPKIFTAGMSPLMVAAGDEATMLLAGREASAAKGKM